MSNNPVITMPDTGQESSAELAPLPSFEEVMNSLAVLDSIPPPGEPVPDDPIYCNPKIRGMRWTLNGPLETAIMVARGWDFDPDEVAEPYYQGLENGKPVWHPIAKTAITKPKVSSLQLCVEPLDLWDYNWMEVHEGHTDFDEIYDPANVLYGRLPDVAKAKAGGIDDDRQLLICCGLKRPWERGTELLVKATGAFVTVHDFVSAVHLYLMARRDDILDSMNLDWGRTRKPFLPETRLMVEWNGSKGLDVTDEAEWMDHHTRHLRKPKPYSGGIPLAHWKEMIAAAKKSAEGNARWTRPEIPWGPEDD